jgi:hypothetical protein
VGTDTPIVCSQLKLLLWRGVTVSGAHACLRPAISELQCPCPVPHQTDCRGTFDCVLGSPVSASSGYKWTDWSTVTTACACVPRDVKPPASWRLHVITEGYVYLYVDIRASTCFSHSSVFRHISHCSTLEGLPTFRDNISHPS